MKKTVMALVAFAAAVASAANTWWVAKEDPNASDSNPGTEALPFRTINAAANNSNIAANDTINVKPGVYDEGGQVDPQSGVTNRVYLPVKIVLHAVEGREKTFIVGAKDPKSADAYGRGPAAVRCVYATAADTRIEGFTIRDGVTNMDNPDAYSSQGGGILTKDGTAGVYILDCAILNCSACKGGGIRGGSAIRCLLKGNYSNSTGSAGNGSLFAFSVIDSNRGGAALSSCKTTNCTIVNNDKGSVGWAKHYNSVFAGNKSDELNYQVEQFVCSTCTETNGIYQVFAPALEDYRLVTGTAAVGLGDAKYFASYIGLGKTWFEKDFLGNAVPAEGAVNAGAVQATATPAAGAIRMSDGSRTLIVDGKTATLGAWAFPEAYPTQWNIRGVAAAGEHIFSFPRPNIGRIHPMLDGSAWIMPSPDPAVVVSTYPSFAKAAFWVNPDPEVGSDDNPGTEALPFRTLQKAVDVVTPDTMTVIYAAAGDYNEGGRSFADFGSSYGSLTNRVCIPNNRYYVRICGAGAGKSFITGAADPVTGGNGPGAIRPVGCGSSQVVIQDFTIRGGYSDLSTSTPDASKYAAIYGSGKGVVYVQDCVITGNGGYSAAVSGASVFRSAITNNTPDCSVVDRCVMSSCLVADNATKDTNSYVGQDCNLFGCTVRGISRNVGAVANYVYAYGCVLETSKTSYAGDRFYESLLWDFADYSAVTADSAWTKGDPCFVDAANGDYHVRSMSPAVTCMGAPTASNYGAEYFKYACGDLEGKPVFSAIPVAGCYQTSVASPGIYALVDKAGISVAPGYTPITESAPVTVTLGEGTRPCIGYVANGETNLFEQVPSRTFTLADVGTRGVYLETLYSNDWYVDANAADDSGRAFTAASAKKTFKGLFDTGYVLSGDTVHAAAGTYDSGVMFQGEGFTVGSRLVVPQGVTVIADEGPDVTSIVGADATVEPNAYGMGTNAVRCVYLRKNAKVSGFTLTGGRTGYILAGTDAGKTHPENIGGGAVGASSGDYRTQVAENCIITGNVAHRGGGACYVTLRGCRVIANRGTDTTGQASGTYNCSHFGTVIDRNIGNYAAMYAYDLVSSTVGYGNASDYSFYLNAGNRCNIANSIVCGQSQIASASVATCTFFEKAPKNMPAGVIGTGSEVCGADALQLDADCRPVVDACRAIDRGDLASYDPAACGVTDATGGQRVYNGALDAGALEADWRPVYARLLTRGGRFAVTSADADVVRTDAGTVSVGKGQSLAATWTYGGSDPVGHVLRFKVSGTGSLVITVNGEEHAFAAAAGEQSFEFTSAEAVNDLNFAYVGGAAGDSAELVSCRRNAGAMLILR